MATTTTPGAGSLRTRVRIDQQSQTRDAGAGYTVAWNALLSTRAERMDLSGGETLRAMAVTATSMRRYRLRFPPSIAIDATMRLVDLDTNETFNIKSISTPDQKRRWLILTCEFVPGSGGA